MMFFKLAQQETRYLGYFSNKICHQEIKNHPNWSHCHLFTFLFNTTLSRGQFVSPSITTTTATTTTTAATCFSNTSFQQATSHGLACRRTIQKSQLPPYLSWTKRTLKRIFSTTFDLALNAKSSKSVSFSVIYFPFWLLGINSLSRRFVITCAVVMVKWSVYSPSTHTLRVFYHFY